MKEKLISIFVIYLVLASSISLDVLADTPSKTNPYSENGKPEEQEKWILENPNLFIADNPSQREAFPRAYSKGNVKYPTHIEAISKYVGNFNQGIPNNQNDRKIASEFVAYSMKRTADLKEGSIIINIVQSQIYII